VTTGAHDNIQIYPNFIYNTAGNGQVANANVTTYNSFTALIGIVDTPAQKDDKGKWRPGPNTVGGEASITGNLGYSTGRSGPAAQTSATATALIFYQRAFGNVSLGAALGGTYETGGGGWGGFLRIGIGADWQPATPLQFPSAEVPFH